MKKIISIILALSMISILGICVFAADNSVTVEYEVAADYTVVIPESITMTNGSATQTISVTAGSLIYADETLEITISNSANYADGFRMEEVASVLLASSERADNADLFDSFNYRYVGYNAYHY